MEVRNLMTTDVATVGTDTPLKEVAGEAMTQPAITVEPKTQVAEAASIMTEKGVNRLPVVEGDELVGIVTRADLVRAFNRSDHEIRHEIEEDVVLHRFWISPGSVTVTVADGEVTLAGEVETEDNAELLGRYVARVPGVVTLNSKLHWRDSSS